MVFVIEESGFQKEIGVTDGQCRHGHTDRRFVGVATEAPEMEKRLGVQERADRLGNSVDSLPGVMSLLARSEQEPGA